MEYPVIDMHAHLRDDILAHTEVAYNSGIDFVVAMPNPELCLDNLDTIKKYADKDSAIPFAPMSAITIGREGKELVDVEEIAPYVVGFSDDGNCLTDMGILEDMLYSKVWVMLHSGVDGPLDELPRSTTETEWVERCLNLNASVRGKLYLQHISRKESVDLIRQAKKEDIPVVAETCPHYFKWTSDTMRVPVNPPIGNDEDRDAVREGLSGDTINVIASDYAPEPRPKETGIADWENYNHSCRALVEDGVVTPEQLKSLMYLKPKDILEDSGGRLYLPDDFNHVEEVS
jgi:dihydroorotase